MALPLTRRQKEFLDYIESFIGTHGYAPTMSELGKHFGIRSLATVHKHLSNLEQKGFIRRLPNRSRAVELRSVARKGRAYRLPLLGHVAAGHPIEPVETPDTITVPDEFSGQRDTFVLRVRGDSMVGEGILDGDYIVVEGRPTADSGDTVVATVRGEATVKKFYRGRGGAVRLQPANDRMKPIIAKGTEVEIKGVVVAVLRKYRSNRRR